MTVPGIWLLDQVRDCSASLNYIALNSNYVDNQKRYDYAGSQFAVI